MVAPDCEILTLIMAVAETAWVPPVAVTVAASCVTEALTAPPPLLGLKAAIPAIATAAVALLKVAVTAPAVASILSAALA
jgi:hypothetical protein